MQKRQLLGGLGLVALLALLPVVWLAPRSALCWTGKSWTTWSVPLANTSSAHLNKPLTTQPQRIPAIAVD